MASPSTSSGRPHSRFRPISFRRATTTDLIQINPVIKSEQSIKLEDLRAGQEAKDFYESLISSPETSNEIKRSVHVEPKPKRKAKHKRIKHAKQSVPCSHKQNAKLVNNLLHGAQNGDIKKVKDALRQGCDVNSTDGFSWTALMCASHSGHKNIVRYLLSKGATWRNYIDQKNRSALDLLKSYPKDKSDSSSTAARTEPVGFTCQICQVDFKETSREEHESSTVHIFNSQRKPHSTYYHIPEGNIGFQMLLKDGWDKEQGLGPDGKGLKFPVKTILKRDRHGLGANPDDPQSKPRVTHFQPHDVAAVKKPDRVEKKMRANTLSKKSRKRQEMKERTWEINFRQSFNTLE